MHPKDILNRRLEKRLRSIVELEQAAYMHTYTWSYSSDSISHLGEDRGGTMNGTGQGCPLFREEGKGKKKKKLSRQLISYFIGGNESR